MQVTASVERCRGDFHRDPWESMGLEVCGVHPCCATEGGPCPKSSSAAERRVEDSNDNGKIIKHSVSYPSMPTSEVGFGMATPSAAPTSPTQKGALGMTRGYSPRIHAMIQEARRLFGKGDGTPEQMELTLLRQRLSLIRPEDVNGERLNILSRGEVGYLSLEDNSNFTIGVFFLAPGAQIPLHDHPEMCVISQLVKGTVHVTSFDFDFTSANNRAFLVDDALYSAPVTRTLFPTTGGNLHSFATKTGCIILDVMSPPYDEIEGRECTYFKASRFDHQYYKVNRTEPPEDFEVLDLS